MGDYVKSVTARRSRRSLLSTGAKTATAVSGAAVLASCAGADAQDDYRRGPVKLDYGRTDNPFGADGAAPLDVVIFKGGYSDEYATKGHEPMYKKKFPDAHIIHTGIEQISESVRQRFDNFEPPDILLNAGGERMDVDELVERDLLLDLRILLDAPSMDKPGTQVTDTLRKGVITSGQFGEGDEVWGLPYSYSGYGLWYSQKLFDQKGWKKPKSWSEFLDLCATMKSDGIAPLAHPGRYPYYMLDPIVSLAVQRGGVKVLERMVDDFDSKAWNQDELGESVEAWEEFVAEGYVLDGCDNLDHRDAQKLWANGEAAFVPCGSWLENEEKDVIPSDFELGFMPLPALEDSSSPGMIQATPGEHFVVPKYANNPAGGLEYLRLMLSDEGSQHWVDHTSSLNAFADNDLKSDKPGVVALAPYIEDSKNVYTNGIEVEHATFANSTLFPAIRQLFTGDASASRFLSEVSSGL